MYKYCIVYLITIPNKGFIVKVLCVRTQPEDVPGDVRDEIAKKLGEVEYVFVNPMTSDELFDMAHQEGVAAVYLQEQPLPTRTLSEGHTPILVRPPTGGVMRLTQVNPVLQTFAPS